MFLLYVRVDTTTISVTLRTHISAISRTMFGFNKNNCFSVVNGDERWDEERADRDTELFHFPASSAPAKLYKSCIIRVEIWTNIKSSLQMGISCFWIWNISQTNVQVFFFDLLRDPFSSLSRFAFFPIHLAGNNVVGGKRERVRRVESWMDISVFYFGIKRKKSRKNTHKRSPSECEWRKKKGKIPNREDPKFFLSFCLFVFHLRISFRLPAHTSEELRERNWRKMDSLVPSHFSHK